MSHDLATLQDLHAEAMSLCDRAIAAKVKRDHAQAGDCFRQAFLRESEAAALVADGPRDGTYAVDPAP